MVRNFGDEPAYCAIELAYDADFADLFEVKEGRAARRGRARGRARRRPTWSSATGAAPTCAGVRISLSQPAVIDANLATFEVIIPPRGEWSVCQQFSCSIDGDEIEPRWLCGQPVDRAKPAERMAQWRRSVPMLDTDHEGLRTVVDPQRRGPRGAAHLRPRLPGADGGGGRGAVVHDPVRAGLADHVLDGAAGRPRPGPRRAADPGPLPGRGGQPPQRGGARPHPPRDALRRGVVAVARAAARSTTARPTPRRCS